MRVLLLSLFALVVLREAWVGDDAFISMRAIDNLVEGRGFVYNVGERVQVYTHPLWALLVAAVYWVWREPFWVLIGLGTACSVLATVGMSRWLLPAGTGALIVALPLSRAFVDYSTSGLENPLTHVLYVGLMAAWLSKVDEARRVSLVALLTALMALNRLDAILLAAPILAATMFRAWWSYGVAWKEVLGRVAVGFLPLVAWEVFSLVYYGMFVPLTALAKLGTGVPAGPLAKQGGLFLLYQMEWDPITLVLIVAGVAAAVGSRDLRGSVIALGAALYVTYVVKIGGDFMAGRFLTAPMLAGLVLLARLVGRSPRRLVPVAGVIVLVGLAGVAPPVLSDRPRPEKKWDHRGIADERYYYVQRGGGINKVTHSSEDPAHRWRDWGARLRPGAVKEHTAAGVGAFYSLPKARWYSLTGLTDPLLARLPPKHKTEWRVGHFYRHMPEGYKETLETGSNKLRDPQLAALYDALVEVHQGPVWTWSRFRTIVALHRGDFDFDMSAYRYPEAVELEVGPVGPSSKLDAPGAHKVTKSGAFVRLNEVVHESTVVVRRREDNAYLVVFERRGVEVGRVVARESLPRSARLSWEQIDVPRAAVRAGYDTVRVLPFRGKEPWVVQRINVGRLPRTSYPPGIPRLEVKE